MCAVSRRECVTKAEATQLTQKEHNKLHMHCDHIRMQLLDQICSPLLDLSITQALMECACCKNVGNMHIHALLAPITQRQPLNSS